MERELIVRISKSEDTITTMPKIDSDSELTYLAKRVATTDNEIYKAKWTERGLIYTHKMNAKGEFEEIKSQEQLKAEAFDIIKKKSYFDNNVEIECYENCKNQLVYSINFNAYDRQESSTITEEEYEILKKAGLE